ncbi:hypothetical protein EMCRGX_G020479 [Ephydatia muelleri]
MVTVFWLHPWMRRSDCWTGTMENCSMSRNVEQRIYDDKIWFWDLMEVRMRACDIKAFVLSVVVANTPSDEMSLSLYSTGCP